MRVSPFVVNLSSLTGSLQREERWSHGLIRDYDATLRVGRLNAEVHVLANCSLIRCKLGSHSYGLFLCILSSNPGLHLFSFENAAWHVALHWHRACRAWRLTLANRWRLIEPARGVLHRREHLRRSCRRRTHVACSRLAGCQLVRLASLARRDGLAVGRHDGLTLADAHRGHRAMLAERV